MKTKELKKTNTDLNNFKKKTKKNWKVTSAALPEEHYNFLKKHDLSASIILRQAIDLLMRSKK